MQSYRAVVSSNAQMRSSKQSKAQRRKNSKEGSSGPGGVGFRFIIFGPAVMPMILYHAGFRIHR